MHFYAHSRETGEYQLLKDHLEAVANKSMEFAHAFGAGYLGYLAGLLHDVGKYSAEFQQRIRGSSIRVDHSTAGAQWIARKEVFLEHLGTTGIDKYLARLIAYVISGHHGGLRNYGAIDDDGTLLHRLSKKCIPDWSMAWKEIGITKMRYVVL